MNDGADEKKRITSANLDWGDGSPRSIFFDDIYFTGDGLAETDHVFLKGNDLPARFANRLEFSVGELGFGTGLNFLATWAAWRAAPKPAGARLQFLSTEAHPLSATDLQRAQAAWPELAALAARLNAAAPPPSPGFHRIAIDDGVTLTLAVGDALSMLEKAEGRIDAWYFDGFAPAKNPDMWSEEIFRECARLSAPGATGATFTVAGAVRRNLAAAGFRWEKRPGFGSKREMLVARLAR